MEAIPSLPVNFLVVTQTGRFFRGELLIQMCYFGGKDQHKCSSLCLSCHSNWHSMDQDTSPGMPPGSGCTNYIFRNLERDNRVIMIWFQCSPALISALCPLIYFCCCFYLDLSSMFQTSQMLVIFSTLPLFEIRTGKVDE